MNFVNKLARNNLIGLRNLNNVPASGLRSFSNVPATAYLSEDVVSKRVFEIVKSIKSCPEDVSVDSLFVSDLGFDSLLRKELYDKLSDEFCVNLLEKEKDTLISVSSSIRYFSTHPKAR